MCDTEYHTKRTSGLGGGGSGGARPIWVRGLSVPRCRLAYFRYKATSGCVDDKVVEPGDIENMDVGVEIMFLAVLCAEIVLLAVWAAAISISGITRFPVTSSTTPLNRWTSKTWT